MLGHVGTTLIWNGLLTKRFNIKTIRKDMERLYRPLGPLVRKETPKSRAPKRAPFFKIAFENWAPKRAPFFKTTIQRIQLSESQTQDPQSKIKIQNLKWRIQSPKLQDPRSIIHIVKHVFVRFFSFGGRMMQWLVLAKWLTNIGIGKLISDALWFWQIMPLQKT